VLVSFLVKLPQNHGPEEEDREVNHYLHW
jgi:hypothetical protein